MDSKSIWKSKTFWMAILQALGGLLAAYLTKNPTWAYGATAKSALDVGLRLVTDQPIEK